MALVSLFVIISQPRKLPPSSVTSSSNPQEGHSLVCKDAKRPGLLLHFFQIPKRFNHAFNPNILQYLISPEIPVSRAA